MGHGIFGLFALTITACIPVGPQPSYYGAGSVRRAGSVRCEWARRGCASGLSCMQLFSCFQTCQDGACYQQCLGQADAGVQQAASAALQCSSQRCANGDGNCLAQQCSAEVQACTGTAPQVASSPQPIAERMKPGQPHSTSNLLPWMTGAWIGTNHQFEFHADGRVRRASGIALATKDNIYHCSSIVNDTGTVRQEGDLLIMEFGASDTNHCHQKSSGPALTVRYRIDWVQPYGQTEFSQLVLRDIDCTRARRDATTRCGGADDGEDQADRRRRSRVGGADGRDPPRRARPRGGAGRAAPELPRR